MLHVRSVDQSRVLPVAGSMALPAFFLASFASLGAHMYWRLGEWPEVIGTDGFPGGLTLHADVAGFAFASMLIGLALVVPLTLLACATVPRLRPGVAHIGFFALSAIGVLGLMQFAPDAFLYWWWD